LSSYTNEYVGNPGTIYKRRSHPLPSKSSPLTYQSVGYSKSIGRLSIKTKEHQQQSLLNPRVAEHHLNTRVSLRTICNVFSPFSPTLASGCTLYTASSDHHPPPHNLCGIMHAPVLKASTSNEISGYVVTYSVTRVSCVIHTLRYSHLHFQWRLSSTVFKEILHLLHNYMVKGTQILELVLPYP
jgi:hypothetical protein